MLGLFLVLGYIYKEGRDFRNDYTMAIIERISRNAPITPRTGLYIPLCPKKQYHLLMPLIRCSMDGKTCILVSIQRMWRAYECGLIMGVLGARIPASRFMKSLNRCILSFLQAAHSLL